MKIDQNLRILWLHLQFFLFRKEWPTKGMEIYLNKISVENHLLLLNQLSYINVKDIYRKEILSAFQISHLTQPGISLNGCNLAKC